MRDDDDPFEGEFPAGNLYQSGIRSEEEVEPAEYALPPGVAALQDEDSYLEQPTRVSRRQVIAFALCSIGVGTASFITGKSQSTTPSQEEARPIAGLGRRLTQEDLKLIRVSRVWAKKPIETLVKGASAFLWVFHLVEPDEIQVHGLKRLCEYARLQGGEKGYDVAVRILATFEEVAPPPELESELIALGEVVWKWQAARMPRGRR